jgi:nucleotide-binding universal stress UspA family protein
MRILIATDGSQHSEAAVHSVARRPWPKLTEIKLVSVVDPAELIIGPLYGLAERIGRAEEMKRERAQEAISAASRILDRAGLKSTWDVLEGETKTRIIEEAKAWGAELVVVGARGRSGIDQVMPGSVSEAVAMRAHCSVEVIPHRAQSYRAKAS